MSIFDNTPFDPSTWDPSTWQVPTDTPSTFDDPNPTFTENRYQIAFHNQSHKDIIVRCVAFNSRTGTWSGNWDHFWSFTPDATMRLDFPGIGPFVGNFFRFAAVSTDNAVHWGSPQAPHSTGVGPPYNTTGGFFVHTESMIGP